MANQDFFLNPDEAQTMGNINYMRKSVRVRHTFPKTLKNPDGFEVVKEVSSSEDRSVNSFDRDRSNDSAVNSSLQPTPTISKAAPSYPQSRPQGSNMDMFRNMARKIRKR